MLNDILATFYERDIYKLIEEVNLFKDERNLWRTQGSITNPAGNLVLHLIGGSNFHIGTTLGHTGYVRNRDMEFTQKDAPKEHLIAELEKLITTIRQTLGSLTLRDMEADFPGFFDKPGTSTTYVLTQLLLHLNYHLGQINYLRRSLEY